MKRCAASFLLYRSRRMSFIRLPVRSLSHSPLIVMKIRYGAGKCFSLRSISINSSSKWRRHAPSVCVLNARIHTQNKNHLIAERYKRKIISYWSCSSSWRNLFIFCLFARYLLDYFLLLFTTTAASAAGAIASLSFYVALLHDFPFVVDACQTGKCLTTFVRFGFDNLFPVLRMFPFWFVYVMGLRVTSLDTDTKMYEHLSFQIQTQTHTIC